MTRELTCRELCDFLWAYLDGEVREDERLALERHLAVCPACVAYLDTYRETVALGKMALSGADEPVPQDVPEDLVAAILAARKSQPP